VFPYILFEKYIHILALIMASPGNQHCAIRIGTVSFPISNSTVSSRMIVERVRCTQRCRRRRRACLQHRARLVSATSRQTLRSSATPAHRLRSCPATSSPASVITDAAAYSGLPGPGPDIETSNRMCLGRREMGSGYPPLQSTRRYVGAW